jgi:hypothetical protein
MPDKLSAYCMLFPVGVSPLAEYGSMPDMTDLCKDNLTVQHFSPYFV